MHYNLQLVVHASQTEAPGALLPSTGAWRTEAVGALQSSTGGASQTEAPGALLPSTGAWRTEAVGALQSSPDGASQTEALGALLLSTSAWQMEAPGAFPLLSTFLCLCEENEVSHPGGFGLSGQLCLLLLQLVQLTLWLKMI